MLQRGTLLSRHRILDPYYRIHHNPGILEDAVDFRLADWTREPRRIGRNLARRFSRLRQSSAHMFAKNLYRSFTLVWFSGYFVISRLFGINR